jgi:hypothetical protein
MKAFRFFIGLWLIAFAQGFFFSSENEKIVEEDPKKIPNEICLFWYPSSFQTLNSHVKVVHEPPPRKPRRGLKPSELAHADLLIRYRECDCFHPNTEQGWKYLEDCVSYFSDLDKGYQGLLDIKNLI